MNIKELSILFGVSQQTIRRAIRKALPDALKNGVETRLSRAQVQNIFGELWFKGSAKLNELDSSVKVDDPHKTAEVAPQNAEVNAGSITQLLRAAADAIESRDRQISVLTPKAEIFDHIADSTGLKSVGTVAKIMGMGRNKFFAYLRDSKILDCRNIPYQEYMKPEYFEVKDSVKIINGKSQTFPQAFFTGKGELWISRKLSATHLIGAPEQ